MADEEDKEEEGGSGGEVETERVEEAESATEGIFEWVVDVSLYVPLNAEAAEWEAGV